MGAEVLIATPHRLLDLLRRDQVSLKAATSVILDEVDSLFLDESYPLKPIGEGVGEHTQFLFTSATLPPQLLKRLAEEFPGVEKICGAGLHRTSPHVTEVLIDCSHHTDKSFEGGLKRKFDALRKVLAEHADTQRTLIFCNTVEQCRKVENFLKREDRSERMRGVLAYHSAVHAETRQENLKEFTKPLQRHPMVLICTDRTSRGMDFDASSVDHVVLFDFPREAG
ncbi:DEAD/DEAH box helicase, partial [archaeon]